METWWDLMGGQNTGHRGRQVVEMAVKWHQSWKKIKIQVPTILTGLTQDSATKRINTPVTAKSNHCLLVLV